MQEPISDGRASYHGALSYPQNHVPPTRASSLGSALWTNDWRRLVSAWVSWALGRRKPLNSQLPKIPTLQNPNSQDPPELDHLLPNNTATPITLRNPHTISSYRLTIPKATKNPLSPNLHNPRFSLNLSTPQPHPFPPLSRPIILLSHTATQTTGNSKSETMRTPSHHHKFTKL